MPFFGIRLFDRERRDTPTTEARLRFSWLWHARLREHIFILAGIFGLLITGYILVTHQRDIRTKAAQLKYGEALREQERQLQEEQRQQEAAWHSWEAEMRRELARQGGVRSIELSSASLDSTQLASPQMPPFPPPQPLGFRLVTVEVRSEPAGAEVFLDWMLKGRTPLRLQGEAISGLLVVGKEEYQAWFQQIDYRNNTALDLPLSPEQPRSRTRLLLVMLEQTSPDPFSFLSSKLIQEGFTVLGPAEAAQFQREFSRAQQLSSRALRAWARARFDTDLLVVARFQPFIRELSQQDLTFSGIRERIAGAVRVEAVIELDVQDLRSGDHLTAISSKGTTFALDRNQGIQKALTQTATDAAKKLRLWIQR